MTPDSFHRTLDAALDRQHGEVAVAHVLTTHADLEEYARIFNEGYEAAMAQHLADDPGAADDWLAARLAEARTEERERIAQAIEAVCKARVEATDQRRNFSKGATAAYTQAARIARSEAGA